MTILSEGGRRRVQPVVSSHRPPRRDVIAAMRFAETSVHLNCRGPRALEAG
jgi:hypothetical protein